MNILKTSIEDVLIMEPEKHQDERGSFVRIFDRNHLYSFQSNLKFNMIQTNLSFNKKKGTIRGLHYQVSPYLESKVINCPQGSVYDVVLDLRKESKTYKEYFSIELSRNNNLSLYIPPMIAHGYQTLEDNTIVLYHTGVEYSPECTKEINYKSCNIIWKEAPTVISEKDKNSPILKSSKFNSGSTANINEGEISNLL